MTRTEQDSQEEGGFVAWYLQSRTLALLTLLVFLLILGVASYEGAQHYRNRLTQIRASNQTAANLLALFIGEHQKATVDILRSYATRPLLVQAAKGRQSHEAETPPNRNWGSTGSSGLIFVAHPGTAPAQPQPSQLRTTLRQGIEKAFNLEIQSAMALFRKVVEMDRENPLGYAFLAMTHMFAYETSLDQSDRVREQESMLQDVDEALARGQKRIEKNARDGQAYFAVTLAKIVKIRWAIAQKSYLTIMNETATVWDYTEKIRVEDPQNYDIYFARGLLHYHLDHLPAAARFFSSLFITSGNREKGLQELLQAAQKGDLLKELAQAELVSVYANFEGQPAKALPIVQELKEKFPRNYNFAFALATTLSELQRFPEAFAVAGEIERGIQAGRPPFALQLLPRHYHLMGRILFNQKEYARAAEYFQKALLDTSATNARTRVSALVRLGMIRDIRGEREKAKEYYSRALDVEGGEGVARTDAVKYLATPYTPRSGAPIP